MSATEEGAPKAPGSGRSGGPSSRANTVLLADHEPEVGEMCRRYLSRAGLDVQVVSSPAEALGALAGRDADLFVLDLTMPGLEVPAVRRSLFGEGSVQAGECPPAVFLLDRLGIRPRGLVDGPGFPRRWLARPFSPRALSDAVTELLAPAPMRPAALSPTGEVPRQGFPEPAAAQPSGLQLDGDRRRVTVAGQVVSLTRTEFALVAALARQPGRALSRQQLLAVLERERGKRPTARAVDVYITQLRAKLGGSLIKTVHGIGYRLGEPV
jgi:DNA-binding response OmpR family regulator